MKLVKKTKLQHLSTLIVLNSLLSASLLFPLQAAFAETSQADTKQSDTKQIDSKQSDTKEELSEVQNSTKDKNKEPAKKKETARHQQTKTDSKKEETKKTEEAQKPEPPIENVVDVTTDQLTTKPEEYLNKNVKFTAPFFAFSNLALDYKPAFRSSRTYLSFLVLRANTHTPYSEIKLAMLIPKEKDPQTKMLQGLKEGDTIEITGRVFATSLDEPWLDVLRLKKLASAKKASPDGNDKDADDNDSSDEQNEK